MKHTIQSGAAWGLGALSHGSRLRYQYLGGSRQVSSKWSTDGRQQTGGITSTPLPQRQCGTFWPAACSHLRALIIRILTYLMGERPLVLLLQASHLARHRWRRPGRWPHASLVRFQAVAEEAKPLQEGS